MWFLPKPLPRTGLAQPKSTASQIRPRTKTDGQKRPVSLCFQGGVVTCRAQPIRCPLHVQSESGLDMETKQNSIMCHHLSSRRPSGRLLSPLYRCAACMARGPWPVAYGLWSATARRGTGGYEACAVSRSTYASHCASGLLLSQLTRRSLYVLCALCRPDRPDKSETAMLAYRRVDFSRAESRQAQSDQSDVKSSFSDMAA